MPPKLDVLRKRAYPLEVDARRGNACPTRRACRVPTCVKKADAGGARYSATRYFTAHSSDLYGLSDVQCSPGDPCRRCEIASSHGMHNNMRYHCVRTKLPKLVHDFLPRELIVRLPLHCLLSDSMLEASMTVMHQKQTIEDTVKDQVDHWSHDYIEVYLTSGYGPPMKWNLYEFEPKSRDLLGQLQYRQDPITRKLLPTHKYSPPLGLKKLDASDDDHVDAYLAKLLEVSASAIPQNCQFSVVIEGHKLMYSFPFAAAASRRLRVDVLRRGKPS
jgi:hypothetical protein